MSNAFLEWRIGMEVKKGLVYTNEKCIGCNKCISVCPVATPDFCRKMSIKHPSNLVITRFGGLSVLSDFHSIFSKI